MNQKELIAMVAKAEGLKSQATIGDIREIWKLIKKFNFELEGAVEVILEEERRNKMAKKKTMKKKVTPKKK